MQYRVEVYTQYSDGEIELEEEYDGDVASKEEAQQEIDEICYGAWYGSYVKAYIDKKLVMAKSIE